MKRKNSRSNGLIGIIFLILLFAILHFLLSSLPRLGLAPYKGVITSFQYGICLLMLRVNHKYGDKISISLSFLALINVIFDLFRAGNGAIPGIFNGITGVYNRKGLYIELEITEYCMVNSMEKINRKLIYAFLLNNPLNPVTRPLTPFIKTKRHKTGPTGKKIKIENLKNVNARKVCKPFKIIKEIHSDFE